MLKAFFEVGFVIVTHENLDMLPVSVEEVLYHEMYRLYDFNNIMKAAFSSLSFKADFRTERERTFLDFKEDSYDGYELLKNSGGRLPIDTFELTAPVFQ